MRTETAPVMTESGPSEDRVRPQGGQINAPERSEAGPVRKESDPTQDIFRPSEDRIMPSKD